MYIFVYILKTSNTFLSKRNCELNTYELNIKLESKLTPIFHFIFNFPDLSSIQCFDDAIKRTILVWKFKYSILEATLTNIIVTSLIYLINTNYEKQRPKINSWGSVLWTLASSKFLTTRYLMKKLCVEDYDIQNSDKSRRCNRTMSKLMLCYRK